MRTVSVCDGCLHLERLDGRGRPLAAACCRHPDWPGCREVMVVREGVGFVTPDQCPVAEAWRQASLQAELERRIRNFGPAKIDVGAFMRP